MIYKNNQIIQLINNLNYQKIYKIKITLIKLKKNMI